MMKLATNRARTTERPESGRVLAATRFRAWLTQAEPGQLIEYYRGLLIWDRSAKSELQDRERRVLERLADAALAAAAKGLVHLVQQRRGKARFSYLAVRAYQAPGVGRVR
jgi:hypothetical protein